jgi:threonyl-tRNA synthetase
MPEITLPDGSVRRFDGAVTGAEIAAAIGPGLARAALAMRVDGKPADLSRRIAEDASVVFITRRDPEALEMIRHDAAHVLAEAVQSLYPGTQVTIGPPIENGFYYDFARNEPFRPEDFPAIEARMREIVARNAGFVREEWDRETAIAFFEQRGERYKAELIRDLPESETISIYRQGEWLDLCRGPHMRGTGDVGTAFKLMKVAGAYWRGDHRNAMLTRIYGTAATTAASAARWICSMCRRKRWAASSGTRRAGSCIARWKPICAAGWKRPSTRRSRHRSWWIAPYGSAPAIGRNIASICSSRPSRRRKKPSR